MAAPKNFPISFNDVCLSSNGVLFTGTTDRETKELKGGCFLYNKKNRWRGGLHPIAAIGVCSILIPESTTIFLAINRQIGRLVDNEFHYEIVMDKKNDSEYVGPVSEIRTIDKKAYVVGMNMAYRYDGGHDDWVRIDISIRDDDDFNSDFRTIHGFDENNIYAAGHNGCLAHFDGKTWSVIEIQTNVIFNRILCAPNNKVYISGQRGVLLVGKKDKWEVIETDIKGDIWSVTWFKDTVYACTDDGLYRLINNELQPVSIKSNMPLNYAGDYSFGHLDANEDVIWSVGAKMLLYSNDGIIWHEPSYELSGL